MGNEKQCRYLAGKEEGYQFFKLLSLRLLTRIIAMLLFFVNIVFVYHMCQPLKQNNYFSCLFVCF